MRFFGLETWTSLWMMTRWDVLVNTTSYRDELRDNLMARYARNQGTFYTTGSRRSTRRSLWQAGHTTTHESADTLSSTYEPGGIRIRDTWILVYEIAQFLNCYCPAGILSTPLQITICRLGPACQAGFTRCGNKVSTKTNLRNCYCRKIGTHST